MFNLEWTGGKHDTTFGFFFGVIDDLIAPFVALMHKIVSIFVWKVIAFSYSSKIIRGEYSFSNWSGNNKFMYKVRFPGCTMTFTQATVLESKLVFLKKYRVEIDETQASISLQY